MADTDTLREVLRYCTGTLQIAERFYDAPTVMVLTQIIDIIADGGEIDPHTGTVSND